MWALIQHEKRENKQWAYDITHMHHDCDVGDLALSPVDYTEQCTPRIDLFVLQDVALSNQLVSNDKPLFILLMITPMKGVEQISVSQAWDKKLICLRSSHPRPYS